MTVKEFKDLLNNEINIFSALSLYEIAYEESICDSYIVECIEPSHLSNKDILELIQKYFKIDNEILHLLTKQRMSYTIYSDGKNYFDYEDVPEDLESSFVYFDYKDWINKDVFLSKGDILNVLSVAAQIGKTNYIDNLSSSFPNDGEFGEFYVDWNLIMKCILTRLIQENEDIKESFIKHCKHTRDMITNIDYSSFEDIKEYLPEGIDYPYMIERLAFH